MASHDTTSGTLGPILYQVGDCYSEESIWTIHLEPLAHFLVG